MLRRPLALLLATAALAFVPAPAALAQGARTAARPPAMIVWKTRTCGCCVLWVDHMRAHGFAATVRDVEDLEAVKRKLGVRPELGSCHTAEVGGFVVEGHVPAEVVKRLLAEKPLIAGLAVPGMPIGSPGMEVPGGFRQAYNVLAFDRGGQTRIYERRR